MKFQWISKPGETVLLSLEDLHLIHLLEQIVIDFLTHNRIGFVTRVRPDEVPDPRRWGLELSGGTLADEIEVFKETATLAVVDV